MQRAAVLVGVSTAGDLPTLQATTPGVRQMEDWALSQGMRRDLVQVITDEDAPVDVSQIKRAIRDIVDRASIEQLIVYFAGHGVNINYGERWLLSDAPADPQAAVNVDGSVQLARWCGIPNVVLVSDACRTAADGIQAQAVSGSEIFPNLGPDGPERDVDVFFACSVGKVALEIRDPAISAASFEAIYTSALVEALNGDRPQALDPEHLDGALFGLVRLRRLKEYLSAEIVRRLTYANLRPNIWQTPAARITSGDKVWLSRVPLPFGLPQDPDRGGGTGAPPVPTLASVSRSMLRDALVPTAVGSPPALPLPRETVGAVPGVGLLTESAARTATPFGPLHFETDCGFKVRGTTVRSAYCRYAGVEILDGGRTLVRINGLQRPGAPVLLTFDDGRSALLPAIRDFLAGLSYEDGELVDVAYEPSDASPRWPEYLGRAAEIRRLRALVAASARLGVFQLEHDDAPAMARQMQVAKSVDPTMAVYAAYAYHQLGLGERIVGMDRYLEQDHGIRLFDISLLAGQLTRRTVVASDAKVIPFIPLLSQGWALLSAHQTVLPRAVGDLHRHLVPSLWTLIDPDGAELLRSAMSD